MLNRNTPTSHGNAPRPWGIISPRRAQTTILDGTFVTDNRRVTKIHHHNRQTINDSSNSTVFNAPVNGYVHTAKNGGAVNGHVQITNVSRQVGISGHASPRDGHNENLSPITTVSSHMNTADRTISQKDATQVMRGGEESENEVGRSITVAVGNVSSSAPTTPDLKLGQELHSLSPGMQAFARCLQRDARDREGRQAETVKKRNHTM